MIPKIDPAQEAELVANFIKETLSARHFKYVVVAVSGGVDSAVSLSLAVKALGPLQVFPLLLPYKNLHHASIADAKLIIEKFKIPGSQVETVDIGPAVEAILKTLGLNFRQESDQIRSGNVMARVRMIVIYDRAKKHQALVLGTENKSEHYLSYFTRFGDEAADIEPIRHLYKTQVYDLAAFLGIPDAILTKAPTAGLWSGQTDEAEFGFSYSAADQILYGLYEKNLSVNQLVKNGIDKNEILKVKTWVARHWFKHEVPLVYQEKTA